MKKNIKENMRHVVGIALTECVRKTHLNVVIVNQLCVEFALSRITLIFAGVAKICCVTRENENDWLKV